MYSNGVSEEIIGKALKKYDIPREKVTILSKCWGYVGEEPGIRTITYGQKISESKDYVNQGGMSMPIPRSMFTADVGRSFERRHLQGGQSLVETARYRLP